MARNAFPAVARLALLLSLVLPAAASADVDDLYDEYRSLGFVRGCAHSEEELREALAQIPSDIRAYDPGFTDSLNAGLEQRAASCTGTAAPIPAAPATPGGARVAADGSPGPAGVRIDPVAGAGTAPEGDGGWPTALLLGLSGLAAVVAVALLAGVPRHRSRD